MSDKLFHQTQISSYCRLHSINNLVQREICTPKKFEDACDEWDELNHFTDKCSRTENGCNYYNSGGNTGTDNIFGYVMLKNNVPVIMIAYDLSSKVDKPLVINNDFNVVSPIDEDLLGVIVMNTGHTWCAIYKNEKFYVIDSLKSNIAEVKINYFTNRSLKYIVVHRHLPLPDER